MCTTKGDMGQGMAISKTCETQRRKVRAACSMRDRQTQRERAREEVT